MQALERARLWLANVPAAISGQNGHAATYAAACGLVHGFALSDSDAHNLLTDWNRGCQPPWSDSELNHKIRDAARQSHDKPRGYLLNAGGPPPSEPVDLKRFKLPSRASTPMVELDQTSPVDEFIAFLKAAFAEKEIVCICNDLNEEGKPQSAGSFLSREAWIERFAREGSPLLVPGMGAFVRINPFVPNDYSGSDKAVTSYRHVLVEMDVADKETQKKILVDSNLPISVLIDSGGKSIHGWVRVDAADRDQWNERRDIIYHLLASKGIDPKNKNPSRYSRLPGADRSGTRQRLLAVRLGADTWENWQSEVELAADESTSISVVDLIRFEIKNDPDNLIGDRWLTKGSSMILSGGSGIGKSSLLMQLVIQWSTGQPWFGISPIKPLRIGVIQAENNTGDLAEAFQGVIKSYKQFDPEWNKTLMKNLSFRTETTRTGVAFLDYARRYITKSKLDLIIADPLLSYFGEDLSDQSKVSVFLRNHLQPILQETGVCWIWIHHIAKPSKNKEEEPPSLMELAYSGFGSSELTNWAREVAVIQEVGQAKPRRFRLAFCKRGSRLPRPVLNLAHSDPSQGISWVEWNPLLYKHHPDGKPQKPTGAKPQTRRSSDL